MKYAELLWARGNRAHAEIAPEQLANRGRPKVNPELQRTYAKRMGATIVEVKSSHVPMLSRPNEVLGAIRKAAAAVAAKRE